MLNYFDLWAFNKSANLILKKSFFKILSSNQLNKYFGILLFSLLYFSATAQSVLDRTLNFKVKNEALEDVLYDIQQMSKASYGGFKVKRIKALDTLLDESIGFKYNLLPKGVYSLAELSFNPSDLSRVEGIIEWLIGSHDYFSYLEVGTDFRGEEFESVSGKPLTYEDRDLILLQLFELFKTDVRWAQADFSDEIDFEELSSGDYEETHLEILVSGIRKNSKLWKAFRAMVSEHKPAWSKRDDFKLANNGGLSILKRIPSTKNSAGACKSSLRTGIH